MGRRNKGLRMTMSEEMNTFSDLVLNGKTTWYVDSSVNASGDGDGWDSAFLTIAEAITASSAGDVIRIRGEFASGGAAITLSKELILIGDTTSPNQQNTLIYSSGAATALIIVDAHNCKIFNIGFSQSGAAPIIQIGNVNGEAWWKLHIKGCKFEGNATATFGITYFDSSVDAPDIVIENNLFRSMGGPSVTSDYTRGWIIDNIFLGVASQPNIQHVPTGGSRPHTVIKDNVIIGVNSGDTGILISNTPSAGTLIATDNRIYNCATSITQKAENVAVQMNYANDGAGGALIDPIA